MTDTEKESLLVDVRNALLILVKVTEILLRYRTTTHDLWEEHKKKNRL